MKLIIEKINSFAELVGYIHVPDAEMFHMKTFPAILILPGGAFRVCAPREAEPVAMKFFAEGYQAFVLNYTTVTADPSAKMEDPMKDVESAIRYLRENSEGLFLADGKLALLGFSGGGHLAAAVATHSPERPDALILGYPGIVHSDLRALECPDILERVDGHTPPAFIFSSRYDAVTPPVHTLSLALALEEAGVDFELHIFRGCVHGLSLGTSLTSNGEETNIAPAYAKWFGLCVTWLTERFGDFSLWNAENSGKSGS